MGGTKEVTRIFGSPRFVVDKYGNGEWLLTVEVEDFGALRKMTLRFNSQEEAENVTVNYRFL